MSNRDNAHDVATFPDEKITKRSVQTKYKPRYKYRERSSNLFK